MFLNIEHWPFKFAGFRSTRLPFLRSTFLHHHFGIVPLNPLLGNRWVAFIPNLSLLVLCYCSYPVAHLSFPWAHLRPREMIQWSCTRRASNSIPLLARVPYVSYWNHLWCLSIRSSCCFFFRVRGIPPPIAPTSLHADVFIFIALYTLKSHSLEIRHPALTGSCRFSCNLEI